MSNNLTSPGQTSELSTTGIGNNPNAYPAATAPITYGKTLPTPGQTPSEVTPATFAPTSGSSAYLAPIPGKTSSSPSYATTVYAADYGTIGQGGNDSAVIQEAIAAASALVGGPANSPGATVIVPEGTYLFNVVLAYGVILQGMGLSSCFRPYNQALPCISGPQAGTLNFSGVRNAHLYGYGSGSRVTPYTPTGGMSGNSGQAYICPMTLASAITSGGMVSAIVVNAVTTATTIAAGTSLIVGNNGASVQVFVVSTTTTVANSGTTSIPVTSESASAAFPIPTVGSCTGSSSSTTISSSNNFATAGVTLGMAVTGTNIAANTFVTAVGTTTVTLNIDPSGVVSGTLTFSPAIMASGGFADGIFIPMGSGSGPAGTLSGTNYCVFENLLIENFGNNGFHLEGGSNYQTHQFNRFINIWSQYNQDAGYYLFGEIQANDFQDCGGQINKWHIWALVEYLQGNEGWWYTNRNVFLRCLANQSGNYLSSGSVAQVSTITHGLYNEGNYNTFDTCYFEANGLGNTSQKESAGVLNYLASTGTAANLFIRCSFSDHFINYWDQRGNGNQVWFCDWNYSGNTPTSPVAYIRLDGGASNCSNPVIGPQAGIPGGEQYIYCGSSFTAGNNPTLYTLAGAQVPFPTAIPFTSGSYINYGVGPLTTGTVSDIVLNENPAADAPAGWFCTVSGTPGTWVTFGTQVPTATLYNDLLGTSFSDPAIALSSTAAASGTVFLTRIPIPSIITVTNVLVYFSTLGNTLTNSYVGLYNSAGTLIGQSADQSTAWGTGGTLGIQTIALVGGPYTVTPLGANDFVWVAIYQGTATTAASFGTLAGNVQINAGCTAARSRAATFALSNTATLPSFTPSSLTQVNNLRWAALS